MLKSYYQHIKNNYISSIDPDASKLVTAFKCTIIGLLIFIVSYYIKIPQAIFLFFSAISLMIIAPTELPRKNLISMSIATLFMVLGCFLVTLASRSVWQLSASLFVMAFVTIYLNKYKKISNFTGIVALMVIVAAAGLGGNLAAAIARVLDVVLGLIIAIVFSFLIWPYHTFKKTKRRLAIVFDKAAEYFFHTIADSMRGNHLLLKHHQKKNEILIFNINNQSAIAKKAVNDPRYQILKEIVDQQESLLWTIFSIANLFNQPLYYSSAVYSFPNMKEFCLVTVQVYRNYAAYLRGNELTMLSLAEFDEKLAQLHGKLQRNILAIMQANIVYQWPFDLSNLSYLLTVLKRKTESLNHSLKKLC